MLTQRSVNHIASQQRVGGRWVLFQAGGNFGDNFGQRRGLTEAEFGKIGTPVTFQALTQSNTCRPLAEGFFLVVLLGDIQGNVGAATFTLKVSGSNIMKKISG